jgi:hypothetical protein
VCGGGKEFCDLFRAKRRGGPEEEVGKCVIKGRGGRQAGGVLDGRCHLELASNDEI